MKIPAMVANGINQVTIWAFSLCFVYLSSFKNSFFVVGFQARYFSKPDPKMQIL